MYIRESKTRNKKTGKVYVKHSLVESIRTPNGPRQRTVMQLGQLTLPRKSWPPLAAELERRIAGQETLPAIGAGLSKGVLLAADEAMKEFGARTELKAGNIKTEATADYLSINKNSVTSSYSRSIGAELLVHDCWHKLGFPKFLKKLKFSPYECSLAEAAVAARLIHPGSDLDTWQWIRSQSAIGELTPENLEKVCRNRVYNIADKLWAHHTEIENHLADSLQRLYSCGDRLFLFDLTNLYLEGQALGNTLARRGKSKEKRSDCKLVSLALAVDSRGFPLFSRVYPGNISEPSTLKDILEDAGYLDEQPLLKFEKPTIVMDRGIATKDNIQLMLDNDIAYIVVERGARNQSHLASFKNVEKDPLFTKIERCKQPPVWVKKVDGEREGTVQVLCMSKGKREKEKAMEQRWEERAREDLLNLQRSIQKGNIKAENKILRKLGRLEERYPKFNRYFEVNLVAEEIEKTASKRKSPIKIKELSFTRKAVFEPPPEETNPLLGTYVIETVHRHLSAEEIWSLYMTLTRVEKAFRSMKTDLGTRPVFHQLAERTEAHLFISVVAYGILSCIEHRLLENEEHRSWPTIRQAMQTHRRTTVIMTDDKGRIHHLRQTASPEAVHLEIYRKLNIDHRMARTSEVKAIRL